MNSPSKISVPTATAPLSLFRVYSPFKPKLETRIWAHGKDEAISLVPEKFPALARFPNLKALAA